MSFEPIPTRYAGRFFRSRTEARWAIFFDACGIPWQYEPEGFELSGGKLYLPDFWLPAFQAFFEVKGVIPTEEEREKCRDLSYITRRMVLLAEGQPEERFQIRIFIEGEEDEELWVIARDRCSEAGFYLVAPDDMRWLGGGDPTPGLRRGPMFSGALEEAYATALSARFEHGEKTKRVRPIPETDPARAA